jgi:hippurate hydrolase
MNRVLLAALPLLIAASPALAQATMQIAPVDETIRAHMPGLLAIYRDLHANPELSFQEVRSAAIMADAARKAGFAVTEKVGGTGVVAVLRNGSGPTVLIRADMDGLPVVEQTGLSFASTRRGVSTAGVESGIMHACGHDTHMTAWIETARLLSARKADWAGTLVMIAQPAEELGKGARAMLADGLYTRFPKPDVVLAFHDSADLPAGAIGAASGYAWANADSVDVLVRGVGGHGAAPQTTKDPIVLASAIVLRLQTLVSREMNPVEPAVVTVGAIHGGAKHNVVPDEVRLQLTVRSYGDETRAKLLDGIRRIVAGEAMASGMPADKLPEVTVAADYTRSTYNTPALTERIKALFRARFGAERVLDLPPAMVAEDFGEYGRADRDHIASLIFRVGAVAPEAIAKARREARELPSLHSALFAPQADTVIATAAEALTLAALDLMPKR